MNKLLFGVRLSVVVLVLGGLAGGGLEGFLASEFIGLVQVRAAPWFVSMGLAAAIGGLLFWRPFTVGKMAALSVMVLCYVLSVRLLVLNAGNGLLVEYWGGIQMSDSVIDLDDQVYCLQVDTLYLVFKAANSGDGPRYFRGIWPIAFAAPDITKRFGLIQCLRDGG